jgi:Zn-dependent protease
MEIIFGIAILILSIVVHEVAHGYAAAALGDPTARYAGRLTLNPLSHLDPIGSVVLPLVTYFSGGFIFGWAKPVPYNPYNLRHGQWGEALVALAGPASNIALALFFGVLIRFAPISETFISVAALVAFVNINLAVFNMVPIPPLDGSKVLFAFLPYQAQYIRRFLEQWGFPLVILFVVFLWQVIAPVTSGIFTLITGLAG